MASGLTLATLTTRVQMFLGDPGKVYFSDGCVQEGAKNALDELTRATLKPSCPVDDNRKIVTIVPGAGTREVSLGAYADLLHVAECWFPYVANDVQPQRIEFIELNNAGTRSVYMLGDGAVGDGIKSLRVIYQCPHTINGLNGAATTTFEARVDSIMVLGTAAYALYNRCFFNIEDTVKGTWASPNYGELATRMIQDFRAMLGVMEYVKDSSFSMAEEEPKARKARKQ